MSTRNVRKTDTSGDIPCRRRGRPMGKNRVPLSLEERRARNAQYEKQRRNETSDAMAQLARAAGCDINMSNGDLLASVVAQLQRAAKREPSEDIDNLRRCNQNLMQQIAELEQRLGWSEVEDDKENLIEYIHNTKPEAFQQRNTQSNVKRHDPLGTNEVAQQETFELKFYSNDRDANNEA